MKEDRVNCDVSIVIYLFECYSNNAQEVKEKIDKYIEDFTEDEESHFWFRYRTEALKPSCVKTKYYGGNLTDEQKKLCERIKEKYDVYFM